jgi:hypothetical protein
VEGSVLLTGGYSESLLWDRAAADPSTLQLKNFPKNLALESQPGSHSNQVRPKLVRLARRLPPPPFLAGFQSMLSI